LTKSKKNTFKIVYQLISLFIITEILFFITLTNNLIHLKDNQCDDCSNVSLTDCLEQLKHIIYYYIMQICSFERGQPHFALPRKTDSTLADELEHDGRAYKHFLAIYSDNLNNFIRIHKDCLGEL